MADITHAVAQHQAAHTRAVALGHWWDAAAAQQAILDLLTLSPAGSANASAISTATTARNAAIASSHVYTAKGHDGTVIN